jgi:exodeoxyribonuclease VII large subunit
MEEAGLGSLQAAFEALKQKLQAEGLFDAARKKPIPILPRHVGVVTSPTGAAIRDILSVVGRRFPNIHLILAPVRVQGAGAAEEIAAAIDLCNERGGFDVLIVGRGGGSMEDLWCFNEEVVARAIARSRIPVISAVGHEIDFTIADFVADLRAPTPSAAAEMVVGRKDAFETALREAARRLAQSLGRCALEARHRLLASSGSYVFREPRNMVGQYRQHLGELGLRMTPPLSARLQGMRQRAEEARMRVAHRMAETLAAGTQDARRLQTQLNALNPMAVLARGYSITQDSRGRVVRSVAGISRGERLLTRLAEGNLESEVTHIHDKAES